MSPEGRALTEVARSMRCVPSGRASTPAGHGRPRHVLTIERLGPVPRFPTTSRRVRGAFFEKARLRKQGVATMRHVRPQAEPATAGRRSPGALAEGQSPAGGGTAESERKPGNDEASFGSREIVA